MSYAHALLLPLLELSPSHASNVREFGLYFRCKKYDDEHGLDAEEAKLTTEEYRMLRSTLTRLERMQHLLLSEMRLHWPNLATFRPPQMDSIMELTIIDTYFPDKESLTMLLTSLPNVRHISVDCIRAALSEDGLWPDNSAPMLDDPGTPAPAPNLRSLTLVDLDMLDPLRLLLSLSPCSLHFGCYHADDMGDSLWLLCGRQTASSLSELSLNCCVVHVKYPNLSKCPQLDIFSGCLDLRSLRVWLRHGDGLFQWAVSLLSCAPSCIRTISLQCLDFTAAEFECLAATLDHERPPHLGEVTLGISEYSTDLSVTGDTLQHSDFHERGILKIGE